ncbi:hypothetical protein [Rhodoferax sp.]
MTQIRLPELLALERIIEMGAAWLETRVVCSVTRAQHHAQALQEWY